MIRGGDYGGDETAQGLCLWIAEQGWTNQQNQLAAAVALEQLGYLKTVATTAFPTAVNSKCLCDTLVPIRVCINTNILYFKAVIAIVSLGLMDFTVTPPLNIAY